MGQILSFNFTSAIPFPSAVSLSFRTYAKNGVGYGAYSAILTVTTDSVPLFMNIPIIKPANINPTWIYVSWAGIIGDTQTGGDSASFYGLQWDQGTDNWTDVISTKLGMVNSFNITTQIPIASALPLQFRTYAVNGVGMGAFSQIVTITSDSVPLFMNVP